MIRTMLCLIGVHRWSFVDERNGNEVATWAWCKNPHCPRHSRPQRVNVHYLP